MVQLCKNDVLVTPQHINIKKTVFFYFDEKQITERHMLHIKKKTRYRVLTNSSGQDMSNLVTITIYPINV